MFDCPGVRRTFLTTSLALYNLNLTAIPTLWKVRRVHQIQAAHGALEENFDLDTLPRRYVSVALDHLQSLKSLKVCH